jgi:2-polyprenyl-3-methyl-5-hydroxy-6-metoxy-1,4-benzoquinol methylase
MTQHFDTAAATWDQDPMKVKRSQVTAQYCRETALKSRKSILDFGGGTGLLALLLHDSFDQVTLADSSSEMLNVAREKIREEGINNINTVKIENDISEVTGKFSAIITLMTLHHISDTGSFFKSAAELLEDEGALLIADLLQEDGSFHHNVAGFDGHNGFAIDALTKELELTGFTVSQVSPFYEIEKEIAPGEVKLFPLFFLVAEKRNK